MDQLHKTLRTTFSATRAIPQPSILVLTEAEKRTGKNQATIKTKKPQRHKCNLGAYNRCRPTSSGTMINRCICDVICVPGSLMSTAGHTHQTPLPLCVSRKRAEKFNSLHHTASFPTFITVQASRGGWRLIIYISQKINLRILLHGFNSPKK